MLRSIKVATFFLFFCLISKSLAQVDLNGDTQIQLTPLEIQLTTKVQNSYNLHKQELYNIFHSKGGKATGVTVAEVRVTQWRNGVDTQQLNDIFQFTVHYTLYWTSILHHNDGYTEALSTYNIANGETTCVGNRLLKSNGLFNKDDVTSGLTKVLKMVLFKKI